MGLTSSTEFLNRVQGWVKEISKKTCYHTLELPGGEVLQGVIPVEALQARFEALQIPKRLDGKRFLDVGAASGWNSFELERRGAEVVAVDCVEYPELPVARAALGSRVDYRMLDVDELTPQSVGTFDHVLFLGVLYHLRHPLLGLERICALTRDTAYVESFVTDSAEAPNPACTLEFYEIDQLGGQIDNWCGPTTECLLALCRSAGFARVELLYSAGGRAGVRCSRKWEPALENPAIAAPVLLSAVNNRSNTPVFHPNRDEYICAYFRSNQAVTRESIRVEVDGYGAPALVVAETAREWQVNLRVPPGLAMGEHSVRLRTAESGYSDEVRIVVASGADEEREEPFQALDDVSLAAPVLFAVENSADRTTTFHGYRSERLSSFIRTAERGLKRSGVLVQLDGRDLEIEIVIELGGEEWQINAKLPPQLSAGKHEVRVRTAASPFSEPALVEMVSG